MPSSTSPARTTAEQPPVLKLSNPDDVFAAVPYLLGFHPQRSLVVLGLSGPRGRLGVSMRMDLDSGPADRLTSVVVNALRRDGDDQAILVFYDPAEQARGRPGEDLFTAMRSALRRAGIGLKDAYRVSEGRWWSYLCRDRTCCPDAGTEIRRPDQPGGPSNVAATAVAAGMAPLADRAALRASLEPPAPWTREAAEQALDRVAGQVSARWEAGESDQAEQEVLDLIAGLRDRFGSRQPALTEDEAAQVALGLHVVALRDEVITWTTRSDADALQRLMLEVVRRIGAPESVPAATVLAWTAYLRGNGALAGVALEHALDADGNYWLARLLDRLLESGIHPDTLRRQTELTAKDLKTGRGRRSG